MDTELMLRAEYHMAKGTQASLCAGVGVFFLQCCPAYLWIIIPLWNVTFQTHWPQVDHTVVMVCVCVLESEEAGEQYLYQ